MKSKISFLFFVAIFFGQSCFSQQITTDNSQTLEQLIQNSLGQNCVEISNISSTVNGNINGFSSFGYFERGSSSFPFENGIALTTGNISSAGNTLNTSSLNEGDDTWGTDIDLENALGISQTSNATSIQFNFVSVANQIEFNYILASEEYQQEYPCFYSDGFAFLIRESGSNDSFSNIALVPGTSIPVNTNTVHNQIEGFCDAENEVYFEGYNIGDTNYNGRTVVLTATASIIPNTEYEIKLVIADQNDTNFDSAVFIEGNSFNATVDLGPDISTCGQSVTLNGDIQNSQASYQWFKDDVAIENATNTSFTATETGTYSIEITVQLNQTSCVIEDSVDIILNSEQTSNEISDFSYCDDSSNDGVEIFNLSLKDNEVLASVPPSNYNISYHLSSSNAQNNQNPIINPIQNTSSPQTIFVRIEDTNSGCLAFSTFNLVVNEKPNFEIPDPIVACENSLLEGTTLIDLTLSDEQIIDGNTHLNISYHFSQSEANSGDNPITSPYSNPNTSETLYVRVTDSETSCFSTTTIDIQFQTGPEISTELQWINACEQDEDGFEFFDLTSIIDDLLQGLTDVTVSFHETNEEAFNDTNPITDSENYENNIQDFQEVYVRVEDNNTGCASIAPLELHTNVVMTGFITSPYGICDDVSNDGIANFDLLLVEGRLEDEYDGFNTVFYLTEEDRDANLNPLDESVPITVTNSLTIYANVFSEGCIEPVDIVLEIDPPVILEPLSIDYCDEDNDGVTSITLNSFNAVVSQGVSATNVKYFLTEADANTNENILPNIITNTSNPQQLFVRVTNVQTECYDVTTLDINIIGAPEINNFPDPILICDDDMDGISSVNLETKIPDITTNTTDLQITFHNNIETAISGNDEISNPENYTTATQTIFTRVENETTGCFSISQFTVFVNTLPQFIPISNFQNCEADLSGVADFFFNTKDSEILNGQNNKEVLYFENESDAQAGINQIDKFSAYQNTSNPQTIFVRVQNLSNPNCFGTSSFQLEVGTIPNFTEASDISVCDDINNDGIETIDLNETINEISAGSTEDLDITFHTSEEEANMGINPVPVNYTNSTNPQFLFARIDNGEYCFGISAFQINVISVPIVNAVNSVERCDDDYDGVLNWDLTLSELEILDVRQVNIEVSYFRSIEDSEANLNPILNPENFTNTTNPQTVYVKVNNTISNCYVNVPLELKVNLPPAINTFEVFEICENDNNNFDLNTINDVLVDVDFNVLFRYFTSEADAVANTNALDSNYLYTSNNDTIYARVEFSTTHCFFIYPFELRVNPLPTANQPPDLVDCDDDFDGLLRFNLQEQTPIILGFQNPNDFSVTYYSEDNTLISEPNSYLAFNGEVITAYIENNTSGCSNIVQFSTIVNRKPFVEIPDQVVCINNLPLVVSANTSYPSDSYVWSTNSTAPEIEITEIGTYSVTVTSEFGCVTTSTFNVTESESATIELTETVDFSDPNNITVTIDGIGNYLYVLDDGNPQESNVFENVALGFHTVTIIDLNGCAEVTKEVVVVDAPKFFTPNNDRENDTWHIIGIETLPGSIVYVFDRYGKLMKQLGSSTKGWDGTYNGNNMPASDYWFLAEIRQGQTAFDVKGHFSLRR